MARGRANNQKGAGMRKPRGRKSRSNAEDMTGAKEPAVEVTKASEDEGEEFAEVDEVGSAPAAA